MGKKLRPEEQQPEDLGEWEEGAERHAGRPVSLVFSVRFNRDEIAVVRHAAARVGERTSEFIRVAALNRSRGVSVRLVPSAGAPSSGIILFAEAGPNTEAATPSEYIEVA